MVLVQSPDGEKPEDERADVPPATPDTDAASAVTPVEPPEAFSAPPTAVPETRKARAKRFREDFAADTERSLPQPQASPHIPGPPKSTRPLVTAPPAEPSAESRATSCPAPGPPRRFQRGLLLVGAAAAGISLALVVVGLVASRRPGGPPTPSDSTASVDPPGLSTDLPGSAAAPIAEAPRQPDPSDELDTTAHSADGPDVAETPAEEADVADHAASGDGDLPVTEPPATDAIENGADTDAVMAIDTPPEHEADVHSPLPDSMPELAVPLAAVELDAMPVTDFALFVTDFTGLPVSFDLDAMRVAQIAPDTAITCHVQDVTLGHLLEVALASVDLQFELHERSMIITPRQHVRDDLWQATYDVSDLVRDEQELDRLIEHIVSLIAPSSWVAAGGGGTITKGDLSLDIEQNAVAHFEIMRWLDRLRIVRDLVPRSELPDEHVNGTSAFGRAVRELHAPVSIDCDTPTPVTQILDQLRTQTGLCLVVDWAATVAEAWHPTTESTLASTDEPLADVLERWLTPLGLGYRVFDSQTVEITTLDMLNRRVELEVYPVELTAEQDVAAWLATVQQHVADGSPGEPRSTDVVRFEPLSRSLLTRLAQPQQRELAAWLAANAWLRPALPEGNDSGS